MQSSTDLGSWIERLTYAIVTVALVSAAVLATSANSLTAPAVQWVRVASEQMLSSIVG